MESGISMTLLPALETLPPTWMPSPDSIGSCCLILLHLLCQFGNWLLEVYSFHKKTWRENGSGTEGKSWAEGQRWQKWGEGKLWSGCIVWEKNEYSIELFKRQLQEIDPQVKNTSMCTHNTPPHMHTNWERQKERKRYREGKSNILGHISLEKIIELLWNSYQPA